MFKKIAITALAIAVSAPAFAMTATQLERSLGVEPGAYTLSQLTALSGANDHTEYNRLVRFFDNEGDVSVTRSFGSDAAYVPAKVRQAGQDR
ncbi:MAG: hypothetical protein KDE08_07565 [Rhodobacteraceae bacterium]|nr:hypothetical protein [Paracoccaceae bacterium]